MSNSGDPVHLEVESPDAEGGVTFKVFRASSTTEITLAAEQFLHVTDVVFISTVGGTFSIVADTDADGRRLAKGSVAALGGLATNFAEPFVCPRGVTPKLFAATGAVSCIMQGFLTEA